MSPRRGLAAGEDNGQRGYMLTFVIAYLRVGHFSGFFPAWADGQVGQAGRLQFDSGEDSKQQWKQRNMTSGGLWFDLVAVVVKGIEQQ